MQARKLARKIADPFFFRYPQRFHNVIDDAFRRFIDFKYVVDVQTAKEQANVSPGHLPPRSEEPALTVWHTPDGLAFIEEIEAALDYEFVEACANVRAIESIDRLVDRSLTEQGVTQILPYGYVLRFCLRCVVMDRLPVQRGLDIGVVSQRSG